MEGEKFDMHCIVELFGHSTIAGKVTEQTIGGATFIRVDVPKTARREPFTKFYGPSAIYAITPVSDAIATAMAESLSVAPVQEWQLRTIEPSRQIAAQSFPEDWDSSTEGWPNDEPPVDEAEHDERFSELNDSEALAALLPSISEMMPAAVTTAILHGLEQPVEPSPDEGDDKLAAARWAKEMLEKGFVIVDTETTGFEPDDEIIQIGIIDHTGATVLERLIKPTKPIRNSIYHGITDEMVVNAPSFVEVHGQIKLALDGKIFAAYNADYDRRMIKQVCARHGLPDIQPEWLECVMENYAQFNGEWNDYHGNYRWKKLSEALAAFGLKHEDFGTKEHDACTDARATLAVIKKMAEFAAEKSTGASV